MRVRAVGIVALAVLAGCPTPEERAEEARAGAQEALARGRQSEALAALAELRESQPDTPEATLEYATLLVQAGEALQAVWVLEDATVRFPERDELRVALANAALLVQDAARARSAVEAIAPDSEQHAQALVARARAELTLGDMEAALALLEQAESLHPDHPGVRLPRITTLLSERRFDDARTALAEAKVHAESEEEIAALHRLEVTLLSSEAAQGEAEGAIEALREMVAADPADLLAWNALVQLLLKDGRAREARDLVRAARDRDPEQVGLYPILASLEGALGDAESAEDALREFVERSQSPTAYLALARFHAAREQEEPALGTLGEALEAFPDVPMLRVARAEMLVDFGRLEEAQGELRRLREADAEPAQLEYLRARIDLAEGDAAGAAARLAKLVPQLDTLATQYWLGRALEESGDRKGAELRYRTALSRGASDPAPALALVRLARDRGDWRGVSAYADLLVRRLPGRFEVWEALLVALVNLGEGAQAEEAARRLLEAAPQQPRARTFLALALRAQGRHAEALDQLAEEAERFGGSPELDAERAIALGLAGRAGEGIALARSARETHPDVAVLHYALAALLFQQGLADEGARAVDRALELVPDDLRPLRARAEFYAASGRLDDARVDCEAYLARLPDDASVHFTLGVVHHQAGRPEQAVAAYRRAAELDGAAFAPRNNLAELLAERGDLDAALASAQEAHALATDNPYVLDTLGQLYLQAGLVDRSISVLEDAHAGAPELADAQLHLAVAYREAGRTSEAQQLLAGLSARGDVRPELREQVDEALASLP